MPRKPSSASIARAMARVALARRRRRPARRGVVSGRGFYKGFGRHAGTVIGGVGGAAAGGYYGGGVGALTGAKVGGYLGGHIGALAEGVVSGRGKYRINYNTVIGNVPSIRNSRGREGATVVRHKEYIGDVLSSQAFSIQYALPINAAQPSAFPWLAQIAQNYEQYEIQGMLFDFVSSSGDTTAGTTALGDVLMATQYNSLEDEFTSKQQMLNQEFSSIAKPSLNSIHPIECAPRQTTLELLYTRNGPVPQNADIRLYDLGRFTLATSGQQADGQTLGSLYVTYEVVLMKPKLSVGSIDPTPAFSRFELYRDAASSVTPQPAFQGVVEKNNDYSMTLSGNSLTIPKGTQGAFMITALWNNSAAVGSPPDYQQTNYSVTAISGPVGDLANREYFVETTNLVTPTYSNTNVWPNGLINQVGPGGAWIATFGTTRATSADIILTFSSINTGSNTSNMWSGGTVIVTQVA